MILGSILDVVSKAINKVTAILDKGGKARVVEEDEEIKDDEIYYQGVAIEVPEEIARDSIYLDDNLSDDSLANIVTNSIQDVDQKTQEWEPPDKAIRNEDEPFQEGGLGSEITYPDGWEGAYYPAGGESRKRPHLGYIREWVETVKLSNMSMDEISYEYARVLNKPVPNKLNKVARDALVDSITYMVARKIWYVGRRSSAFTDHQWNEHTKHMRPEEGSFGKNDVWKNVPFPYGQEYVYTSGDIHKSMIELKSSGRLSY